MSTALLFRAVGSFIRDRFCWYKALADLGGAWGTHAPPWASKFFRFHAVFGKIWRVHAPPGGFTPPPRENPGSATAKLLQITCCGNWSLKWPCIHFFSENFTSFPVLLPFLYFKLKVLVSCPLTSLTLMTSPNPPLPSHLRMSNSFWRRDWPVFPAGMNGIIPASSVSSSSSLSLSVNSETADAHLY